MANEEGVIKFFFNKIKVKELMTKKVVTIYQDDELSEAEQKFITHKIFYLPVLDQDNKLVGLLSQKYLYKTQSPRKFIDPEVKFDPEVVFDPKILVDNDSYYNKETLDSYILSKIMNKNPPTLSPENTLAEALLVMGRENIDCIVIVDKNRKVNGTLTHKEIVRWIVKILSNNQN